MDLPVDAVLLSYSIQPEDSGRPGVGWIWTVIDEDGRKIVTGLAPNQDQAQTQARDAISGRSRIPI